MRHYVKDNTDAEVVLLPRKSPNLNGFMECWFRSLQSECFDRMIFLGQRSLERVLHAYVQHYQCERDHQGLGNELS